MAERRPPTRAGRAAPAPARRRLPLPWIVGGVAVLVALVVAVAVSAGGDDDGGDGGDVVQTADVTVEGEELPTFAGRPDAAVGTTAPTLAGRSFDGTPVEVAPGRPTIVLFLAHWCPHCQAEVPLLVEHFADGGLPDDVDVVAVSTAVDRPRGNYPPSAWLEEEGWPTPVLVDSSDNEAAAAYGLPGFPYLVALDASGEVVARLSGEFPTETFDAVVELARG
jgi:thiol-disulfide isomerase/thioredoxin